MLYLSAAITPLYILLFVSYNQTTDV